MQDLIEKVRALAVEEINKFGIPKMEHFLLSNAKGQELAEKLSADKDIVLLGTMLMDLKIGQCLKEGRLSEHVKESSLAAQEFLKDFDLDQEVFKKIISCIESHHGLDNYYCLEAEICANADCYRFLSPEGFFHSTMIFSGRGLDIEHFLAQLEGKVDEKYKALSLDICKKELETYYHDFKRLIGAAKKK